MGSRGASTKTYGNLARQVAAELRRVSDENPGMGGYRAVAAWTGVLGLLRRRARRGDVALQLVLGVELSDVARRFPAGGAGAELERDVEDYRREGVEWLERVAQAAGQPELRKVAQAAMANARCAAAARYRLAHDLGLPGALAPRVEPVAKREAPERQGRPVPEPLIVDEQGTGGDLRARSEAGDPFALLAVGSDLTDQYWWWHQMDHEPGGPSLDEVFEEGIGFLSRAAKAGHPTVSPAAMCNLGYWSRDVDGRSGHGDISGRMWRTAAALGCGAAAFNLACGFWKAAGEKDNRGTRLWLNRGARLGDPHAVEMLAQLKRLKGVKRRRRPRRGFYCKACGKLQLPGDGVDEYVDSPHAYEPGTYCLSCWMCDEPMARVEDLVYKLWSSGEPGAPLCLRPDVGKPV